MSRVLSMADGGRHRSRDEGSNPTPRPNPHWTWDRMPNGNFRIYKFGCKFTIVKEKEYWSSFINDEHLCGGLRAEYYGCVMSAISFYANDFNAIHILK